MKLQLLQLIPSAYTVFRLLLTGSSVYTGGSADQIIYPIPKPAGSPQPVRLRSVRMKCHLR